MTVKEKERDGFYFHDSAHFCCRLATAPRVWTWSRVRACVCVRGTPHGIVHEWRFASLIAGIMTCDYVEAAAGWCCRPQGSAELFSRRRRCRAPPHTDWLREAAPLPEGAGWSLSMAHVTPSVWASLPGSSTAGGPSTMEGRSFCWSFLRSSGELRPKE